MSSYYLPINEALDVLKINKATLKLATNLSDERMSIIDKYGVNLDDAEVISNTFGMHPSELWAGWVDAVITVVDWQERKVND